jgi:hypothetical protein
VSMAHTSILATQEAEIRRITVLSQLGQIVRETLSQKRAGGVAQALPSKCEALSSNLSSKKKV